ncbi:hypothetical protein [Microbacterium sp. SA39]|uniref:hypothetical protein n=1 Tax=Microbacterium sp. SA39 TaxID=1263625 RepID=UPI00061F90B0|nr:hypothetical protein [Microbacterium sp. SA39]KJQ55403.1 hypothetical protein RS85_00681 [Microbacterium sp. SA39]
MRSTTPMPGNPWPHDMIITVDDRVQPLLELLWVREAHDLRPDGEGLPPLLVDSPAPAVTPVDEGTRSRWSEEWARIWHEVVAHAGIEHDPALTERAFSTQHGSPEREALFRQLMGPMWGDEFGREVFDDASSREWERRGQVAHMARRPTALEDSPERRDLAALAAAWRRGLTKIVTIPCHGDHVRQVGDHALLVTDGIRDDSTRYREALGTFG